MILAHPVSLCLLSLFLSLFLPKLVAGGHPAVLLWNYIILRQNETRTVRRYGATATWLTELTGWEPSIGLGQTFPQRQTDNFVSYDSHALVCKSEDEFFNMRLFFLHHVITLWFQFVCHLRAFPGEKTGAVSNPMHSISLHLCHSYVTIKLLTSWNYWHVDYTSPKPETFFVSLFPALFCRSFNRDWSILLYLQCI